MRSRDALEMRLRCAGNVPEMRRTYTRDTQEIHARLVENLRLDGCAGVCRVEPETLEDERQDRPDDHRKEDDDEKRESDRASLWQGGVRQKCVRGSAEGDAKAERTVEAVERDLATLWAQIRAC
eukprot:6182344-Pleurochrysis_carterae.AAC.6